MSRPDAFELFALYHLGLEPEGTAKLVNVHQMAARYGVDVPTLTAWLREAAIDAETVARVNYDLAEQSGEVAVLAELGEPETALRFARHVWEEWKKARGPASVPSVS